jgi:hypothetical protein
MQLLQPTNDFLDRYVAPGYSAFTAATIPDMSAVSQDQERWVADRPPGRIPRSYSRQRLGTELDAGQHSHRDHEPHPGNEGGEYMDGPGAGMVFLILQMTVRNVGTNTTNDPVMLGNWQYVSASGQVTGSLPEVTTYTNRVTGKDLINNPVLASGQSAAGYVATIVPAGKGVIQLIDPLNNTPDVQINY